MRLVIVSILLICLGLAARAQGRVALLIGNADYGVDALDLANPANDVAALAAVLEQNGFEVIAATNLDGAGMREVVAAFTDKAQGAELALFFYAGHGVQFEGDNLMIGTGFVGTTADALLSASIPMRDIRAAFEQAAPEAGLILLDACRDAPILDRDLMRPGLVRTSGGVGMLIAYATDPGNVAYDGAGQNSVFTTALLNHIATPGLDVRLMLGRVRQEVVLATYGRQVPWVEESLIGEHVIAFERPTEILPDAVADEFSLWRRADADPSYLPDYLARYPDGAFAAMARARLDQTRAQPATEEISALALSESARLIPALEVMGVAGDRGPEAIAAGVARFMAERPGLPQDSLGALYTEAARTAMLLGAATAQRIRTDLAALRSLDRVARIAEVAMVEMEELAGDDPAAAPVIEQARADIEAIRRNRQVVLVRLDQSRAYYQDVVTRTARFLPPDASPALLADTGETVGLDSSLAGDATLFLRHVRNADVSDEGSYEWLADFIQDG
jgi:uncharacterized caspase-like protein